MKGRTDEVDLLREALVFADGLAVSRTGYPLADLYAEDSDKQGVLARAGCHPRTLWCEHTEVPDA